MTFDSPVFFAVLALSAIGVFALRRVEARCWFLLLVSLAFYCTWDWRFLPLVLFIATATWGFGLALAKHPGNSRLLAVAIVTVLLPLCFFKYVDFLIFNGLALLGHAPEHPVFSPVLPVGISFFTFHAISYVVDVSARRMTAEASFARVGLYISFFPHMVAGPIVRPHVFFPQLNERWQAPQAPEVAALTTRFLWGMLKKTFVADRLAMSIVDPIFAHPEQASPEMLLLAIFAFGLLIYADFSGYSDMAIASARLMGVKFQENFLAPYTATSVREFWRRWHVSLSSWIRDYIYFPLGGSRSPGRLRQQGNLIAAMMLCGLWHGASWAFVLWGLLHGVALAAERLLRPLAPKGVGMQVFGWLLTSLIVYAGWALFRAGNIETFIAWASHVLQPAASGRLPGEIMIFLGICTAIVYLEQGMLRLVEARPDLLPRAWCWMPTQLGAAFALSSLLLLLIFPEMGSRNFIYFQF